MTQWYYARGGLQNGPVSLEQLREIAKSGGLDPVRDLVWNATMRDWLPSGNVEGIFQGAAVIAAENPYAPPGTAWGVGAFAYESSPLVEIEPGSQPIEVMACIGRGFNLTTRHFLLVFLVALISFGIYLVTVGPFAGIELKNQMDEMQRKIAAHVPVKTDYQQQISPLYLAHHAVELVVSAFLTLGATRIALNIVSGEEAKISQFFSQGRKMFRMLGGSIFLALPFWVGLGLLVIFKGGTIGWVGNVATWIVGLYLIARFGQFSAALVDRDLGVIEALKYSSTITRNNRLNLFGLMIMVFLITMVGAIPCGLGLFFTLPMVYLTSVVSYRWMQYGRRAIMDHPGTLVPMVKSESAAPASPEP